MAKDLLFEIGTEEMPANFMNKVRIDYKELAEDIFANNRLDFKECQVYSSPRRLTLYIKDLVEQQRDKKEVVRGPAEAIAFDEEGKPTKAALGFARGQGLEVNDLEIKDDYLYAEKTEKGKKSVEILNSLLPELLKKINFPKSMRWGNYDLRFIRPIRWLTALYGEDLIKFSAAGVETGKFSCGHRFLTEESIKIDRAEAYFSSLKEGYVIVDQERRKEMILNQIDELSPKTGQVLFDEELLTEVVELVEYPTAFYGEFDSKYLQLPDDVLITSMIEHQRYFPVLDDKKSLLPYFIAVRDGDDSFIDEVKHGNEMVLKARLADARFFYDEDLKLTVEERQEKLKEIVYQEKLGSIFDKVNRMRKLAAEIASGLGLNEEEIDIIDRAAELSKNDLVTEMVNEFPKLQGAMGREYALLNGEKEEVARAIFEQYLPRYAGDSLPATIYGQVVSITDKIDNISSHFSLGLIPTGSQDPFALRRQAAGIVSIIQENNLKINLSELINWSLKVLDVEDEDIEEQIKEFVLQRLDKSLDETGIRYDIINAVIKADDEDINDIFSRGKAVMELRKDNPDLFVDLVRGLVRAKNLADQSDVGPELSSEYLQEEAEKELYRSFTDIKDEIDNLFHEKAYLEGLKKLVELKEPVDNFLDNVIVMVDDNKVKNNRLALLDQISRMIRPVMIIEEIALDD